MKVEHAVTAKIDPNCEIRLGQSSWNPDEKSVKYTWFDMNGKAARGGEFPVEALPQMVEEATKEGYLK